MVMKNKLQKHHKSKFVLLLREFSVLVGSVTLFCSAIAIPTYISVNSGEKVATEASTQKEEEKVVKEKEDNPSESEEELLEY